MQKGVSPLLAAVLLVAVTVGIATLTTGFVSTTFRSTETTAENRTTEAVDCANAEIVVDDAFVKAGDNGTVTVPVRNAGFSVLQIASAQLYDRFGNNFSASNMPLSISRGQLLSLNFQLTKFSNTTADSSVMENNGTCISMSPGGENNTCKFTLSGKYGSAMNFDGLDDYVNVIASPVFSPTVITVEAWFRINRLDCCGVTPGSQFMVFNRDDNGGYDMVFENSTKKIFFRFKPAAAGIQIVKSTTALTENDVGRWFHAAATFDSSAIKIYINGILENTTDFAGNVGFSERDLTIGFPGTSYPFNGTIDEVALWNGALTDLEINSTMNNGVASIDTSTLVAYWKFDEGKGVLSCPADFSKVIVSTNCGGISATFDRTPKCS